MTKQRQIGPDIVRGLLLSLVIFGHTFQQSVDHSHIKWMIYAFHMPLFFALTGSLINIEKIRGRSLREIATHYFMRMGWQWLLATFLFMVYRHVQYKDVGAALADMFLDPYFHLWFVPALFLMVLITWLLLKTGADLLILLVVGVASWTLFAALKIQNSFAWLSPDTVDYRFASMYLWFVVGIVTSHRKELPALVTTSLALLGAVGTFFAFPTDGVLGIFSSLCLNLGLALLLPRAVALVSRIRGSGLLAPIGQYSLWIYLLHPLATDLLRTSTGVLPWWAGLAMTLAVLGFSLVSVNLGRFVRK